MDIESARLVYVPFKRVPAGHVFIVFRTDTGEETAISPEADTAQGTPFSLLKGLGKTYSLRYLINHPDHFLQRYQLEGRRMREYPLNLSRPQLQELHKKMTDRAASLEVSAEWYHTLYNSCITNVTRHLDDIQGPRGFLSRAVLLVQPTYLSRR